MLLGVPWVYFVFELTVMNVLLLYLRARHESLCRRIHSQLDTYETAV